MLITSKNNELIKKAVKLQDKKYRCLYNQFLVENEKILYEVIKNNYKIDTLFYENQPNLKIGDDVNMVQTTKEILKHISSTSSPAKCVAIVNIPQGSELKINSNFLVLDRVQDPSNVGAIIRSCLGANFGAVLLIDCADIYDTKTIRSSMGAIFNVPCTQVKMQEVLNIKYPLVVLDMQGENVFKQNFDENQFYGFIVGNEGQGVCNELREKASKFVSIPMNEKLESLNASVSASLVMYAISRKLKENI